MVADKGLKFILGFIESLSQGRQVFLHCFAPMSELLALPSEGVIFFRFFFHFKFEIRF